VWSLPDKPKQRVRVELLNTCTAGTDTNTLPTFTLLLVIRTQRYIWSLDKVGCTAKSSQQSFCHWWQNIHYHSTNLQNHITTNMLDVVRIITSIQQIFSVRSSPDPPIFKKIAVRSSPAPAKIGFSPDPAGPVLIRAHLWCGAQCKTWARGPTQDLGAGPLWAVIYDVIVFSQPC